MLRVKQVLAFLSIFGVAIVACKFLITDFTFTPHGWGWLGYIGGMIAFLIGFGFLNGRLLKPQAESEQSLLRIGLQKGLFWLSLPVGGTLAYLLMPGFFTVVNGLGGWVLTVIMAVAFGLEAAAQQCIWRSHLKKQAEEHKKDGESK